MTLNAISVDPLSRGLGTRPFERLWIGRSPRPGRAVGYEHVMGVWWIWKFAKNQPAAQKFLADLEIDYRQPSSGRSSTTSPPGGRVTASSRSSKLAPQTSTSRSASTGPDQIAEKYTTNPGYPGYTNAAFGEMFNKFLIPQMFAQVAQGKMTAQAAASSYQNQFKTIFAKWKAQGLQ